MFHVVVFPEVISVSLWMLFIQELERQRRLEFCHGMWRMTPEHHKKLMVNGGSLGFTFYDVPKEDLEGAGAIVRSVKDQTFLSLNISQRLSMETRITLSPDQIHLIPQYDWVRVGQESQGARGIKVFFRKVQNLHLLALSIVDSYEWVYHICEDMDTVMGVITLEMWREPNRIYKNIYYAADACGDSIQTG